MNIYYLDEFFNPEVYSFSKIVSICDTLNIKTDIIHYRYAIISTSIEKDIKNIKNHLTSLKNVL